MKVSLLNRRLLCSACIFGAIAASATCLAQGTVILNQPSTQGSQSGYTIWGSQNNSGTVEAITYDNFTPAIDAAIATVSWQGAYVDTSNPSNNPAAANTSAFEISLWTDNAGQPGDLISTVTVPIANAAAQSLGTLQFSFDQSGTTEPILLFGYTATLATPFTVVAGQAYWISIVSDSTSTNPLWSWMSGSGGDNNTVQDFAGNRYQRPGDRALELETSGAQIVTDVNGRAFAAGAPLPLTATFEDPGDGDEVTQVNFLANDQVFASFDPEGDPITSATGAAPTRKESGSVAGVIFKATYTLPGADQLVSIVAQALTKLGKTVNSPAVSVQAVASTTDHAPVVSIQAPASASVGQAITVPVSVSDPDAPAPGVSPRGPRTRDFSVPSGVIAKVEYYLDTLKVKEDTQAPFSYTFTPSEAGNYVLTAIATDGDGLATASAPVTLEATGGPTVTVTEKGSPVMENGGSAKLYFTRSGTDFSSSVTVHFKLVGSARNGVDYKQLGESAVIPAGAASVKLKIKPIEEGISGNGTRTVKVKLGNDPAGAYTVGSPKKATVSIIDNQ